MQEEKEILKTQVMRLRFEQSVLTGTSTNFPIKQQKEPNNDTIDFVDSMLRKTCSLIVLPFETAYGYFSGTTEKKQEFEILSKDIDQKDLKNLFYNTFYHYQQYKDPSVVLSDSKINAQISQLLKECRAVSYTHLTLPTKRIV